MQQIQGNGGGIEPVAISVAEAAKALGISTWVCYQLLDQKKIESRYQGRRRLVSVASLREFYQNLPTEPEPTEESA